MAALNDLFDPRRHERQQSAIPGHVATQWQCLTAELTDISPSGFRAKVDRPVETGEFIRIAVPGLGTRCARVKWSDGQIFGAEFSSPADLRLLFLGGPVERQSTWLERAAA